MNPEYLAISATPLLGNEMAAILDADPWAAVWRMVLRGLLSDFRYAVFWI